MREINEVIWLNHKMGHYYDKRGNTIHLNILDPKRNYEKSISNTSDDMFILKTVLSFNKSDCEKYLSDIHIHHFKEAAELTKRFHVYQMRYIKLVPSDRRLTIQRVEIEKNEKRMITLLDIPLLEGTKFTCNLGEDFYRKIGREEDRRWIDAYLSNLNWAKDKIESGNYKEEELSVLRLRIKQMQAEINKILEK